MKHGQLRAIAHNIADSIASGYCFVIGVYAVDIFGEAISSEDGFISIDFLSGTVLAGQASEVLVRAIRMFAEELPEFCRKHGASVADFLELSATFRASALHGSVVVSVTDSTGRRSQTEYSGVPLRRLRVLDSLGRARRSPSVSEQAKNEDQR